LAEGKFDVGELDQHDDEEDAQDDEQGGFH
jgi:hypothetical protein